MSQPIKNDIVRGSTFKREIQVMSTDLILADGSPNPIISSTSANPALITTKYPHGLTTGDKIYIRGIHANWIVCGNQTVTVVNTTQFTVPVAGQANSTEQGTITKTYDATSFTITLSLVTYAGGSAIGSITVTKTNIALNIFDFYASITATDTALIDASLDEVFLKIHWVDGSGNVTEDYIAYTVGNS